MASDILRGVAMGRSFESVRMGVKEVSDRWLKASRALKKEDQVYGQKLAEMAKKHSSEYFRRHILWVVNHLWAGIWMHRKILHY
ncbi:Uncharacterised protein [uncultured archaeon]|nr:Uncharacterised protein [uncultured archaeon]